MIHAETLLFYDNNQPFCYLDKTQTKGLFFDIVTTVFNNMETEYKVETYPFKRALQMAMKGKGLVVGIYKTEERSLELEFSKPFYLDKLVLFTNKENSFSYDTLDDLNTKQIGIRLGWSYGAEFDLAKKTKLFTTTVGSPQQIYHLLNLGRLDTVIDNELTGKGVINELSISQNIKTLPQYFLVGDIYIAAKKGTNTELIKKFNLHLSRIKDNGVYNKLLAEYY